MDEELLRIIDLFDNDEVTTADKIDRPENPYRDFEERNPRADGGMLVQPSADGRRPGYAVSKTDNNKYRVTGERGGVNYSDWAKENEDKPVDYDKLFPVSPSKSHDKKMETGTAFSGDLDAMLVRRAALAKLAAMSDAELAAFAGDNVVKLDVAA